MGCMVFISSSSKVIGTLPWKILSDGLFQIPDNLVMGGEALSMKSRRFFWIVSRYAAMSATVRRASARIAAGAVFASMLSKGGSGA